MGAPETYSTPRPADVHPVKAEPAETKEEAAGQAPAEQPVESN